MRVTANSFPDSLVDQLSRLSIRQYRLQNQAATGQRLSKPEDDPGAMQRVLGMQAEAQSIAQYRENINRLRENAQATHEVMRGLKRVSDRAGELAVQADGTEAPEQLRLYAIEVTELIKQAAQIANTRFRGQNLLSGTQTGQDPFVVNTDANGRVTSVSYQGNENVPYTEIAEEVTVSTHTVGANASGTGPRGLLSDTRFGADFFNHLISLQNNLMAGDTDAIASTDRAQLLRDEDNLLAHIGQNAAVQARLEASDKIGDRRAEALEILVSGEVDADLAQTIVRLTQTQNAYTAALQTGGQLLGRSLLDYLR